MASADDHVINVCFHGIGTPQRELEPGEDAYWVSTGQFLTILDALPTWPPARVSFDDGNASDLEIALPALADRSLQADFFVLAARLGAPGSLDDAGLRELRRSGMTIGTHGMAHRSWRGLDPAARLDELIEARDRLAEAAQTAVDMAACPLGRYDRRLLADLRRLGYRRVFTSDRRRARRGAWLQPRYSVRRQDTAEQLRAEVAADRELARRLRSGAVAAAKRLR